FGEITWEHKIGELMDKLSTTNLSSKLLEMLKIIENCTRCKDNLGKYNLDGFHKSINKIAIRSTKLREGEKWERLKIDSKLTEIDGELNRKVLCENCKVKKLFKILNGLN